MKQDILFRTNTHVFSCRAAGALVWDGRVLLTRDHGTADGYAIPGGHVALGETAEEALRREFREELHAEIRAERFLASGEIFFPWGDHPCHQICLFYQVALDGSSRVPSDDVFWGYDELGDRRLSVDFCWVPLSALSQLTVYPPQLVPVLTGEASAPLHFVYRQDR